jgi:hypothetical protein
METKQGYTEEWHGSTGSFPDWSGQGLVVSDSDGRNVAIVYDAKRDMALIEAAPELLGALEDFMQVVIDTYMNEETGETCIMDAGYFNTAVDRARAAIRKAMEG